jgi:hypothetical protein
MMANWILLVLFTSPSGMTMTAVEGFSSEAGCEQTGKDYVERAGKAWRVAGSGVPKYICVRKDPSG